MKNIFLVIILLPLHVFASVGFWCPAEPNVIRNPRPLGECYQVDTESFDTETASAVGGLLIVDQNKANAKAARLAAQQASKDARAAKISACESLYLGVDSINTVPQIKELLKCLVRDAR